MPEVVIDCFPSAVPRYGEEWTVVGIDVIRATTTATTALALGRTVYLAESIEDALELVEQAGGSLLVGELGGHVPYGFDVTNSPVQVAALSLLPSGRFTAPDRALILVSSSGIPLLLRASQASDRAVYAACLRNLSAVADHLARHHDRVALIGAGSRGQFRREDQLGCAWLARRLMARGFSVGNDDSRSVVDRWDDGSLNALRGGESAEYLRKTGCVHDLEFVLTHVDDLWVVPRVEGPQLVADSQGEAS
jgi:2-phosphosulfolactate phosphatase